MKAGNAFTIEVISFYVKFIFSWQSKYLFTVFNSIFKPMISEGSWRDEHWPDDWTAVTIDGKRSAQFEQTLLVTETGCEILTVRREKNGQPWFMDSL